MYSGICIQFFYAWDCGHRELQGARHYCRDATDFHLIASSVATDLYHTHPCVLPTPPNISCPGCGRAATPVTRPELLNLIGQLNEAQIGRPTEWYIRPFRCHPGSREETNVEQQSHNFAPAGGLPQPDFLLFTPSVPVTQATEPNMFNIPSQQPPTQPSLVWDSRRNTPAKVETEQSWSFMFGLEENQSPIRSQTLAGRSTEGGSPLHGDLTEPGNALGHGP